MKHAFRFALAMVVTTVTLLAPKAHAQVGARIYAAGQEVTLQIGHSNSPYTSDIFVTGRGWSYHLGTSREEGKWVRFPDMTPGEEVVLSIRVRETGMWFTTGSTFAKMAAAPAGTFAAPGFYVGFWDRHYWPWLSTPQFDTVVVGVKGVNAPEFQPVNVGPVYQPNAPGRPATAVGRNPNTLFSPF
jgi:hypothetical protein